MCSLQNSKHCKHSLATSFLILHFFYLECFNQDFNGRLHTVKVFNCKPEIFFACFFIVLFSSQFLFSTCCLFEVTLLGYQPSSLYKKLKIRIKYLLRGDRKFLWHRPFTLIIKLLCQIFHCILECNNFMLYSFYLWSISEPRRNGTQTINKKEKSSDVDSKITETFNQYDIPLKVSDNIRGENFGRWKIYITT